MSHSDPVVHIPLFCVVGFLVGSVWFLVLLFFLCLVCFYAHGNTYDLLVTTIDWRTLEVLIAYQAKTRYPFQLRLVSRVEIRQAFHTDESRLRDMTCMR